MTFWYQKNDVSIASANFIITICAANNVPKRLELENIIINYIWTNLVCCIQLFINYPAKKHHPLITTASFETRFFLLILHRINSCVDVKIRAENFLFDSFRFEIAIDNDLLRFNTNIGNSKNRFNRQILNLSSISRWRKRGFGERW